MPLRTMFFDNSYFYYFNIALAALCIIHCLRRGNPNKVYWILLIVVLPVIGSLVYIFSEVITGRDLNNVQEGMGQVFNAAGRIKKLEDNLRFTDTFNNRMALADAYLAAGQTDKAIALYENSRTGAFTENEYLVKQLISAYYKVKRFDAIIPLARLLYKQPAFPRSRAHILYALALENTGRPDLAEKEFMTMKARFSDFEARYQYGMFLQRAGREEDARSIFAAMLDEAPHLSRRERRYNRQWLFNAKEELTRKKSA